ncbi:MAG: hypothetical protein AAGM67_09230 [Bacteroidota bacterium]
MVITEDARSSLMGVVRDHLSKYEKTKDVKHLLNAWANCVEDESLEQYVVSHIEEPHLYSLRDYDGVIYHDDFQCHPVDGPGVKEAYFDFVEEVLREEDSSDEEWELFQEIKEQCDWRRIYFPISISALKRQCGDQEHWLVTSEGPSDMGYSSTIAFSRMRGYGRYIGLIVAVLWTEHRARQRFLEATLGIPYERKTINDICPWLVHGFQNNEGKLSDLKSGRVFAKIRTDSYQFIKHIYREGWSQWR